MNELVFQMMVKQIAAKAQFGRSNHIAGSAGDATRLSALDRALELISRFLNLFLGESGFDGFDHSAHRVNLAEVFPGFFFEFAGQLLDEI